MKKLAVLALASVLSVSAYAQDNDNFIRQQPSHGEIPNLQQVGSERIQSKNQDPVVSVCGRESVCPAARSALYPQLIAHLPDDTKSNLHIRF